MNYFSHLATAVTLLEAYDGREPFHLYIKAYFRQFKKFGSTDRKNISQLCYGYFRLGQALGNLDKEEKIIRGLLVCAPELARPALAALRPLWVESLATSLEKRLELAGLDPADLFPGREFISGELDRPGFFLSHLQQPRLFIRIRPGHSTPVREKLFKAGLPYGECGPDCLAFTSGSKLEQVLEADREMVIQDYSSQRMGPWMAKVKEVLPVKIVWDCCAASGGKSILARDLLGPAALELSDIRPAILANLEKRLQAAGIKGYRIQRADLTQSLPFGGTPTVDLLLADVPCSGSGTWGRTPEQLCFFKPDRIGGYQQLQKAILTNAVKRIKKGGFLLYSTCSVYQQENEAQAAFISGELGLQPLGSELVQGFALGADSMYMALFRRD